MSDQTQGTELHDLKDLKTNGVPASHTQADGLKQTSLNEGLDMDIEKTGDAVHTAPPAPPPRILISAASPRHVSAVDAGEKKPSFFEKVKQFLKYQLKKPILFWNKTDKRTMLTASSCFVTVMMLCAMISLAVVTVHGSRLNPSSAVARDVELSHISALSVHTVAVQQRDQVFTSLSDDTSVLLVASANNGACDDETGAVATQSSALTMTNNVNLNVTNASTPMMQSTSIMPVSVDALTSTAPSVAPFFTASTMASEVFSSTSSSIPSVSISQSCLEYGDGAGPCARPYGRPNSTPESWISSLAAESVGDNTLSFPASMNTTLLPIGVPAAPSANLLTSSIINDASMSSWFDSATIDASLCEPTATVYVTITAGFEPNDGNLTDLGGSGNTVFASSTSLSILTVTWSGGDGPLTTTETAFRDGATATAGQTVVAINGTGSLTTLDVPNYTLTMQTTVGPNGTAFSSADPTATPAPYVTSGGEKLAHPKPLGMSGSSSGNGVYCVVMLTALVVLLM
ncbi:hypothetical protein N0V93_005865 [Gnomoniopsis smithogilvyi]|uniref:Transmembrane protein n=1 Tax=Gnomoniopsis smithogilvyi TaxID=1191159 RepID=A0A9W9CYE7_9PEZI|nr:hypothetical protein N0V93_005865 [Gnomoniopsis smithogilvyi]